MPGPTALELIVASVPLWPFAAFLILGAILLLWRAPSERFIARLVASALTLSFVTSFATAVAVHGGAMGARSIDVGNWFRSGDYAFEVSFMIDRLSVTMMVLGSAITGLIGLFAVNYLHREPGFARFFLLLAVFAAGFQLLVMAGSYDLLFAGWELVGISSAMLVAFFHERSAPVRGGLRAFVLYRICDVGLLLGAVLLHQHAHSSKFIDVFGAAPWPQGAIAISASGATTIALLLLLAAMGKSALFPMGNWLPRAMEGPTPSSALFYCALSVHAGAYLMLRSAPLLERSWIASLVVFLVGLVSAVTSTLVWRVQTDAKGALAYASMTHVGLIFAEIGLGFWRLATVHLVAHACLRGLQMLRAPSALRDAQQVRAAQQGARLPTLSWFDRHAPAWLLRRIYRLSHERFHVDALQERLVAQPLMRLGLTFDRNERFVVTAATRWSRPRARTATANARKPVSTEETLRVRQAPATRPRGDQ